MGNYRYFFFLLSLILSSSSFVVTSFSSTAIIQQQQQRCHHHPPLYMNNRNRNAYNRRGGRKQQQQNNNNKRRRNDSDDDYTFNDNDNDNDSSWNIVASDYSDDYRTTRQNPDGYTVTDDDDDFSFYDDDDDDDDYYDDDDDDTNYDNSKTRRRSSSDDFTRTSYNDNDTNDRTTTTTTSTKSYFYSQKDLYDSSFVLNSNNNNNNAALLFRDLVRSVDIVQPSRIQALAWPTVLKGVHTLIADQTGSGKTLAYLIPLVQRALQAPPNKNGTPSVVILAPTSELAEQIYNVCETIRDVIPEFKTMLVTANGSQGREGGGRSGGETTATTTRNMGIRDQMRQIERTPITVLVSTPGRISTILRIRNNKSLDLSQVQTIVLDEVDVLLAENSNSDNSNNDFGFQLRTIAAAAPPDLTKLQFIFVTATLPERIAQTVQREFGTIGLKQIRGPGLHRISPSLQQTLVDVSVRNSINSFGRRENEEKDGLQIKLEQLKRVLRERKCRRTLIFCNTVESCRNVENALTRHYGKNNKDVMIGSYHNAMTPQNRNYNLRTFSNRQKQRKRKNNNDRYNNNNVVYDADHILICTDRASRGVDFDGTNVDHVVVFDFPKDPAEYVRRVGRTARAGRDGYATIMAYGWQLPIARTLMKANIPGSGSGGSGNKKKRESLLQQDKYGFNDDFDDDYNEYSGGARERARRSSRNNKFNKRNNKRNKFNNNYDDDDDDDVIKGNIEGGKLWSKK